MKLSNEKIKHISTELDMGLICYIHKKTTEVLSVPNMDLMRYGDTEDWDETISKVEENEKDYISIEKMSSSESFEIMERFADRITSGKIRKNLFEALKRRKPFRQFRNVLNYSEEAL